MRRILTRLDASARVAEVDTPGFRLHPLKGELVGFAGVDQAGASSHRLRAPTACMPKLLATLDAMLRDRTP